MKWILPILLFGITWSGVSLEEPGKTFEVTLNHEPRIDESIAIRFYIPVFSNEAEEDKVGEQISSYAISEEEINKWAGTPALSSEAWSKERNGIVYEFESWTAFYAMMTWAAGGRANERCEIKLKIGKDVYCRTDHQLLEFFGVPMECLY